MKLIACACGDGIGPEIMEATLMVLKECGLKAQFRDVDVGEKVYLKGEPSGISKNAWDILYEADAFLKGPMKTPQGGGFKSINVTIRSAMGLFANVRPVVSYYPFVKGAKNVDLTIVRENEEDLYTGIEYRQTPQVCYALKTISRPGCERIARYAFEYAMKHGRRKVSCFTKDNIMKISDGLFHKVFDEMSREYPSIVAEHMIVDIGMAKVAANPCDFDIIVLPNLYGDILSDIVAQISGSVGLAGSANIGDKYAMFEAVHGSAPDIAGKGDANPSGLMLAAAYMAAYLEEIEAASAIHNALLKTIEDGIHTIDIFDVDSSSKCVSTMEFAVEIISRLGQGPNRLKPVNYSNIVSDVAKRIDGKSANCVETRKLDGVDVYIYFEGASSDIIDTIVNVDYCRLALSFISNRGSRIWPECCSAFCVDHYRCRFLHKIGSDEDLSIEDIISLLKTLHTRGISFSKIEYLYSFNGQRGYSS